MNITAPTYFTVNPAQHGHDVGVQHARIYNKMNVMTMYTCR